MVDLVGRLMETDEGVVADSSCRVCVKEGLVCKVREGLQRCAFCMLKGKNYCRATKPSRSNEQSIDHSIEVQDNSLPSEDVGYSRADDRENLPPTVTLSMNESTATSSLKSGKTTQSQTRR
jgi:hypothetical protein